MSKQEERLSVRKTWKMYVGGAFIRSESGRYDTTPDGENVCRASRKDLRDAVKVAVAAGPKWAARTAFNRGQILYRLAEVLESRRAEFEACVTRAGSSAAGKEVSAAIDRVVSTAGWCDKYQAVLATSNPVAGPHFGFTVPEPVGTVGLIAPASPSLLGLVACLAPIIVSGNTAVVLSSESDPRTATTLGEALAVSDFPAGVINLLTGPVSELGPHLARHQGVRALDLWDINGEQAVELETLAAETVTRVTRRSFDAADWYGAKTEGPQWIARFCEMKTIWHPVGV